MKRLLALAPMALLSLPAFAADAVIDIPEAPTPIIAETTGWSGFYVGVQAGYGFGSTDELELDPFTNPALITAFSSGVTGDPRGDFTGDGDFDDGFVGGVHVGYDWQMGNIVFGGILDVVGTDISDKQFAMSRTPATYTIERELDYLVTARARLGYAFSDRIMAYVTGGLAYGDVDYSYSQPGSTAAFTTSGDGSDFGYAIGGGVEAKLTQRISLGLEYLYTDLGDNDFEARLTGGPFGGPTGGPGSNPGGTTLSGGDDDFDFHTIQVKLSYHF